MKVRAGVNPDFADFDELDPDAMEVAEGFWNGRNTFTELKALLGPEEAERIVALLDMQRSDDNPDALFDTPDDFCLDE